MSKIVELSKIVKTLRNGLRVENVNGQLVCNFDLLVQIFNNTDLGIIELSKMKSIFSKTPDADIYHPHFLVPTDKIEKLAVIAELPNVIEAYNQKQDSIKGGISNGNYRETLKNTFNILFQNKISEKIRHCISKHTEQSLLMVDKKASFHNWSPEEIATEKEKITSKYQSIIQEHSAELRKEIKRYCIFNYDKIEGKFNDVISSTEAVKRIVLDTSVFFEIYNIQRQEKKEAEEINIDYETQTVYQTFYRKAA